MGSGVRRIGRSCAAAAVLLAGTAQATILTKTVSNNGQGKAIVPLFDTTAGTLLSVYAEASYTSWLPYLSSVAPVGYDHAVSGMATLGSLTFALNGTSQVTSWNGSSGLFTVTANGSAGWTDPAAIALFAGASGNLLGYANASTPPPPGVPISGNFVPSVNYKVTYTYDNSPAVPEPATWAMMVGGFVLTGAALRAARRSRAVGATSKA